MIRRSARGLLLSDDVFDLLVTPPQAESDVAARVRPRAPAARRVKGEVKRRMVSPLGVRDLVTRILAAAVTTVTIADLEHVVVIVVTVTKARGGAILNR